MNQIAVKTIDHRNEGGFAHKQRAALAGGGYAYMRTKLMAAGEVPLASKQRMGREIRAKSQVRYRLRHPDGAYVNMDLSGETEHRSLAWIGFQHQLDAVRRKRPDLAEYRHVEVPPDKRTDIAVQARLGAGHGVMS